MELKDLLLTYKATFKEFIKRFGNGGASIGILKDGKADYLKSEDTLYLISSITKAILTVAVGILVSSGKIKLDTPVEDIIRLHAICKHRNGDPLRVVDLLNHRSNNFGYTLLVMIIEETTGMSWTEFVHVKVFDPLGMARLTADMSHRKPDGTIIKGDEYSNLLGNEEDSAAVHNRFLKRCSDTATYVGAAAGIRSTVSNLFKFYQAYIGLFNERPDRELTELEAGTIIVLDHIKHMVEDPTCAYTGGWNPVHLPWDQKQRAPGADGENYRRLRAVADLGVAELRDEKDF
ncbi:beta-lactamase/transpeptidase-like protein [Diplogelasinospora grovesii]|uniref:Beta-lactamase/transpeptidase-like protein n=1 Tax=Diplogelasinospora grovesii TaxID=303347 RepID=A0AAN6S347_9PEZI|nr:beta-lactamase/transpeptidase-like protein [Diplogelasinospora grovesii]